MDTIVRDKDALERLKNLSYAKKFSSFDEGGKISYLSLVFRTGYNNETPNLADEEMEFAETLKKAIGISGIGATLTTVEGSRTYSRNRHQTINDVIEETERILNDEDYRKSVDTELVRNPDWLKTIREETKELA